MSQRYTYRSARATAERVRRAYIGSGMSRERVLATLETLSPAARRRVEEVAPAVC